MRPLNPVFDGAVTVMVIPAGTPPEIRARALTRQKQTAERFNIRLKWWEVLNG